MATYIAKPQAATPGRVVVGQQIPGMQMQQIGMMTPQFQPLQVQQVGQTQQMGMMTPQFQPLQVQQVGQTQQMGMMAPQFQPQPIQMYQAGMMPQGMAIPHAAVMYQGDMVYPSGMMQPNEMMAPIMSTPSTQFTQIQSPTSQYSATLVPVLKGKDAAKKTAEMQLQQARARFNAGMASQEDMELIDKARKGSTALKGVGRPKVSFQPEFLQQAKRVGDLKMTPEMIQAATRQMEQKIKDIPPGDIVAVSVSLANWDIVKRSASCTITNVVATGETATGTLDDPQMGVIEKDGVACPTCSQVRGVCPGHHGIIEFPVPIMSPEHVGNIIQILTCVCNTCSKLLVSRTTLERVGVLKRKGLNRLADIYKYIKDQKINHTQHESKPIMIEDVPVMPPACTTNCQYDLKQSEQQMKAIITNGSNVSFRPVAYNDLTSRLGLNPTRLLSVEQILNNISDEDAELLGFGPNSHPRSLIVKGVYVPARRFRPPSLKDGVLTEHTLTSLLHLILNVCIQIRKVETPTDLYNHLTDLALRYSDYHSNQGVGSTSKKGIILPGLRQLLEQKEGIFVQNVIGKRVVNSGRAVIEPGPWLEPGEFSISQEHAHNLSVACGVYTFNQALRQYEFTTGVYTLLKPKGSHESRLITETLRNGYKVQVGDKLLRHVKTGDYISSNRQPTLGKTSFMGHRARVSSDPYEKVMRLSIVDAKAYNADFDGDEMNIHVPESEKAAIEIQNLAAASSNTIDQKSSNTLRGASYTTPLGMNMMTNDREPLLGPRIAWAEEDREVEALSVTIIPADEFGKDEFGYEEEDTESFDVEADVTVERQVEEEKAGVAPDESENDRFDRSLNTGRIIHDFYSNYNLVDNSHLIDERGYRWVVNLPLYNSNDPYSIKPIRTLPLQVYLGQWDLDPVVLTLSLIEDKDGKMSDRVIDWITKEPIYRPMTLPLDMFMNAFMSLIGVESYIDTLKRLNRYNIIPTSGRALFSCMLPPGLNYEKGGKVGDRTNKLVIENGVLISGVITSAHVGATTNTITQRIFTNFGQQMADNFLNNMGRMSDIWTLFSGYTITIDDCRVKPELYEKFVEERTKIYEKLKIKLYSMGGPRDSQEEETRRLDNIYRILNGVRMDLNKLAIKYTNEDNRILQSIRSGAKGSMAEWTKIVASIGPLMSEGEIMKALPGAAPTSSQLYGTNAGLCYTSFSEGTTPTDYFNQSAAKRGELAAGSNNTAIVGYKLKTILPQTEMTQTGQMGEVVDEGTGMLVQTLYGGDGMDPAKMHASTGINSSHVAVPYHLKSIVTDVNFIVRQLIEEGKVLIE